MAEERFGPVRTTWAGAGKRRVWSLRRAGAC